MAIAVALTMSMSAQATEKKKGKMIKHSVFMRLSNDTLICRDLLAAKPALAQGQADDCYNQAKEVIKKSGATLMFGSFELYSALVRGELAKRIETNKMCHTFFTRIHEKLGDRELSSIAEIYPAKPKIKDTVQDGEVVIRAVIEDERQEVAKQKRPLFDRSETLDRLALTFNECTNTANALTMPTQTVARKKATKGAK